MKPDTFATIAISGLLSLVVIVVALLVALPNVSDRLTVGVILAEAVGFGGLISVEVFSFL